MRSLLVFLTILGPVLCNPNFNGTIYQSRIPAYGNVAQGNFRLHPRQGCDLGYSLCADGFWCCPLGGICCPNGGCLVPGGECCAFGACPAGYVCCNGDECCQIGSGEAPTVAVITGAIPIPTCATQCVVDACGANTADLHCLCNSGAAELYGNCVGWGCREPGEMPYAVSVYGDICSGGPVADFAAAATTTAETSPASTSRPTSGYSQSSAQNTQKPSTLDGSATSTFGNAGSQSTHSSAATLACRSRLPLGWMLILGVCFLKWY